MFVHVKFEVSDLEVRGYVVLMMESAIDSSGADSSNSAASALAFGEVGLFGLPGKRKDANGRVEWNWN